MDDEVVRVLRGEAEPWEVLHRGERAAVAQPEREGVGEARRLPRPERPRAALLVHERGGRDRHVRDRREVGVDAEAEERGAGFPALAASGVARAEVAHLRRRKRRRDPGDGLHLAALLVHRDEERRLPSFGGRLLELGRDVRELRSGGEVPAMDEHPADAPAARAVEERRGRRVPVHRDDELLPDQVLDRGGRNGRSRRNGEEADGGERRSGESEGHTRDANALEVKRR